MTSSRVRAESIERSLAPTALARAPLTEVPLPEDGESAWVVDLGTGDLLPLWREVRDAVKPLGLSPVACSAWGSPGWVEADLFSRFYYGDDSAPAAVIARAHALSVEDALERFAPFGAGAEEDWHREVAHHLRHTAHDYGVAPAAAVVADVPRGDELALERRLLEWEEAVRPTGATEAGRRSFGWFEPGPHDRVGLVLLPLAEPCHASAYLSWYGAADRHDALVRLACSWQRDFGAELVASWGTMLQFVASKPPATLEEAFELAARHARVSPSTIGLPGETVRGLARHLWRGERWFLHERP